MSSALTSKNKRAIRQQLSRNNNLAQSIKKESIEPETRKKDDMNQTQTTINKEVEYKNLRNKTGKNKETRNKEFRNKRVRADKNHSKQTVIRRTLIGISVAFLIIMLGFPLVLIITEALKKGFLAYGKAILEPNTLAALKLTLLATLVAVTVNTLFGLCAAWTITKFQFKGKNLLLSFIDLPFAISPVIAGLIFVLSFGREGTFHEVLNFFNIKIIFAVPGIILATIFVTFPFVAREIIPLMESQGCEEEVAAALMGAKGSTIFRRITLPNIKWGLLYGVILCSARAMGEFGAVSVVSGHIRGKTNTLPLHIEILYNEYQFTAAFAVASVLVMIAVVILILRNLVEKKAKKGDF